jgi:hypothetical protein
MKLPLGAFVDDQLPDATRLDLHRALKGIIPKRSARTLFVRLVGEAISADANLYAPAAVDDRLRRARLEELRRSANSFRAALAALDANTCFLLRQEQRIAGAKAGSNENWWVADISGSAEGAPASPNAILADIEVRVRTISYLADRMLHRRRPPSGDGKRSRQRQSKPPDAMVIGIIRGFQEATGETPAYSRDSRFAKVMDAVVNACHLPPVGERRLKKLIDVS